MNAPLDDIAKQNLNTLSPEQYAYELLKDDVRHEHVVNSLITIKKLERKTAEATVEKIAERVSVEKQNKWAIIGGCGSIIIGILLALLRPNGRSILFIVGGVIMVVGGLLRRYK
jgi:hypothetical protein